MSPPPPPRIKKLAKLTNKIEIEKIEKRKKFDSCDTTPFSTEQIHGSDRRKDELEVTDFGAIARDGDPLIMKKNMPLLKRKSSGGKFKNPLKALAARMDFNRSPS